MVASSLAVHGQLLLAQRDRYRGARGLEVAHVQDAVLMVRPEVASRHRRLEVVVALPRRAVEAAVGLGKMRRGGR